MINFFSFSSLFLALYPPSSVSFRTLGVVALLQPLQTWAVNRIEIYFPWDSPHEYGAPGGRFHHQRPFGNSHVRFCQGQWGYEGN